jgi:hypothetical protein
VEARSIATSQSRVTECGMLAKLLRQMEPHLLTPVAEGGLRAALCLCITAA